MESYAGVLLDLVEARMPAEDWLTWWDRHGDELKSLLSPGAFLRLKPKPGNDGPSLAAHYSQEGAGRVLDQLGIAYARSDRYHQEWQRAFDQFVEAQAAKKRAFSPTVGTLAKGFPKFARFLKANLDEVEQCSPGLDEAGLARLEEALGLRLPGAYRMFLGCVREIVVGDTLQLTADHPFVHDSAKVALPTQGMLCVGEYWLHADGDQVLFDLRTPGGDDPPVLYYDHGQPGVRPIAPSFTAWIESLPRTLAG